MTVTREVDGAGSVRKLSDEACRKGDTYLAGAPGWEKGAMGRMVLGDKAGHVGRGPSVPNIRLLLVL